MIRLILNHQNTHSSMIAAASKTITTPAMIIRRLAQSLDISRWQMVHSVALHSAFAPQHRQRKTFRLTYIRLRFIYYHGQTQLRLSY